MHTQTTIRHAAGTGVARHRLRTIAVLVAAVAGVGVLVAPGVAFAAGDANSAGCPSGSEVSPGFRSYLPDCRAYELVTPPFKEAGVVQSVQTGAISADGEHVIVGVLGAFAGAENKEYQDNINPDVDAYEFSRTGTGWKPTVLTPPASRFPHSAFAAASSSGELSRTLWRASVGTERNNEDIYMREPDGAFARVGPGYAPQVTGELARSDEDLEVVGASGDLSHMALEISTTSGDLWAGDTTKEGVRSLYEYVYRGTPDPEPLLIGVKNQSSLLSDTEAKLISRCGTELGSGNRLLGGATATADTYNAVSEDGERVFFTARGCETPGPGEPSVDELYARVGGASTVGISEPSSADCSACSTASRNHAVFQGASKNGEKVFFMTEQELLPGQKGMNLYEYDFGGPEASAQHPDGRISLVSGGSASPEVQGVARVSEDGSHVYFVAKAVIPGTFVAGHEPVAGAENLYVYEPETGNPGAYHTVFVAALLTEAEEANLKAAEAAEATAIREQAEAKTIFTFGQIEFKLAHGEITEAEFTNLFYEALFEEQNFVAATTGTRGPEGTLAEDKSVWSIADLRPVQASADGRFLVFVSSADLTADDTSTVPQLFEYDSLTGELMRVSIGENGTYDNNGNASKFSDAPSIPPQDYFGHDRPTGAGFDVVLSEDGSRVFFTGAARLTSGVESGSTNVFEYTAGNVYLISDGHDASMTSQAPSVQLLGLGSSGRDAFFLTADQLVPQDAETSAVLYDAREGGGFPAPTLASGCLGEGCRGATETPPAVGGVVAGGSATQSAGDNTVGTPPEVKVTAKPKSLTRGQLLARALRKCRAKHAKRSRARCEANARRAYGARASAKSTKSASGASSSSRRGIVHATSTTRRGK
jgi:hypothetical protein